MTRQKEKEEEEGRKKKIKGETDRKKRSVERWEKRKAIVSGTMNVLS